MFLFYFNRGNWYSFTAALNALEFLCRMNGMIVCLSDSLYQFDQPSLGLPSRDYYACTGPYEEVTSPVRPKLLLCVSVPFSFSSTDRYLFHPTDLQKLKETHTLDNKFWLVDVASEKRFLNCLFSPLSSMKNLGTFLGHKKTITSVVYGAKKKMIF